MGITLKLQEVLLKNKMIKALRNADSVVYVYDAIEKFLIENNVAQRVLIRNYIPKISDKNNNSPKRFEKKKSNSGKMLVNLIYVGRVTFGKHPEIIIKSLLHLPDRFNLTIIGDGPLLGSLKALVLELKLDGRVEFLGSRPNSEVVSYLQSSFLFVGYSEYEEFPKTYIEAQATGLPVVTNKIDNLAPEIVKSCYVVESNATCYADGILALSSRPDLYRQYNGKSVDFYTENYGNTIVLERLRALYEKFFTQ
jgi:glycosyltransferase involved in cell wall biosynthesis